MLFNQLTFIYFFHSETKFKKNTSEELNKLKDIEMKVCNILKESVGIINNRFQPLRHKLSPKVSVLQVQMEINVEKSFRKFDDRYLENNGFINSHLCVNAETEIEHTEHDSSYTVIAVPSQNMSTSNKINYNCATFQFFLIRHKY